MKGGKHSGIDVAGRWRQWDTAPTVCRAAVKVSNAHPCNAALHRPPMLIWSVSDARLGNRRQAEALAEAVAHRLGARHEHFTLHPQGPWRELAPRWLPWAAQRFDPAFTCELLAARPRLVIGCGRQAALATRIARRLLGDATRVVQILDPRLRRNAWDLLVVPQHDRHRDAATLTCVGSLHPVDDTWLDAARAAMPAIGLLPAPRVGLLLGGPTRHSAWGEAELHAWLQRARELAGTTGSVMAIAAPRTPPALRAALAAQRGNLSLCWCGPDDGDNPYPAVLAVADTLIASPDSVNQLSEAAATRAALLLPGQPAAHGRLARFHAALRDAGRVEPLHSPPAPGPRTPLRDTDRIADAVIARLQLAGRGASPR